MADSHGTAKRKLADIQLPGGIDAFVLSRRLDGKSWRTISLDIRDAIDLDIHESTLGGWYRDADLKAAS